MDDIVVALLISIIASIIGNYVSKWLDGDE